MDTFQKYTTLLGELASTQCLVNNILSDAKSEAEYFIVHNHKFVVHVSHFNKVALLRESANDDVWITGGIEKNSSKFYGVIPKSQNNGGIHFVEADVLQIAPRDSGVICNVLLNPTPSSSFSKLWSLIDQSFGGPNSTFWSNQTLNLLDECIVVTNAPSKRVNVELQWSNTTISVPYHVFIQRSNLELNDTTRDICFDFELPIGLRDIVISLFDIMQTKLLVPEKVEYLPAFYKVLDQLKINLAWG